MICPVCKEDMIVVEYRQVEVDYCTSCHGVWFDAEELEVLFLAAGITGTDYDLSHDLIPATEAKEKSRKCSICRKRMEKVFFRSRPGILLDRCVNGDGLWFDRNELQQALRTFTGEGTEAEKDILSFLSESFQPAVIKGLRIKSSVLRASYRVPCGFTGVLSY